MGQNEHRDITVLWLRTRVKCPLVKYQARTTTGNGSFVDTHHTVCIIGTMIYIWHLLCTYVGNTDAPDRIVGCFFGGSVMYTEGSERGTHWGEARKFM
ncbi:hypothetical protein B0T13DRAFT_460856 [Neurospora crassa]|nr:hypothetical protein B0T13DRAFT_460856 [Neurospora crassa]